MTTLRQAAEMALGALETKGEHHERVYAAIEALRQALAKPCEIEAAVLAEREACAKICDDRADADTWEGGYAHNCAVEIRARGE